MGSSLIDTDGELYWLPDFLSLEESQALLISLMASLAWEQECITVMGRKVQVPRLVAWHGDEGAIYRYSGVIHGPQAWTAEMRSLRDRVTHRVGRPFNSVLGNWYRDGQDSLGWHADKEKALGRNPWIASLSLGATRLFKLRHNGTRQSVDLRLTAGSLLIMGGSLQHHWRHCVPKSRLVTGPRINLTFRYVYPES